ncbi:hypothetical protein C8R47DRAFT_1136109 [Mycena vitilis]|nr:hypothetical protein C8R47DRAFT_1136109 [Mycena vitilis]
MQLYSFLLLVFSIFPFLPTSPVLLMFAFVPRLAGVSPSSLFLFSRSRHAACGLYGCRLSGWDSYERCPTAPTACVAAVPGARCTNVVHGAYGLCHYGVCSAPCSTNVACVNTGGFFVLLTFCAHLSPSSPFRSGVDSSLYLVHRSPFLSPPPSPVPVTAVPCTILLPAFLATLFPFRYFIHT